uniref:FAS1 domain-containing protein n=1 Tax=Picea sitchensis TaxID=3332 RepID=D5AEF1_PICSI|nr:unknown [Picea sitchensis]
MITATGVLQTYQDAVASGLTLLAPTDGAFSGTVMLKLKKLSSAQEVSLLEYHAVPAYNPVGTLKTTIAPISTLATNGASKYALSVSSAGDTVILNTGLSKSTISSTILDDQPVVLYTISGVLLPMEIFGAVPAPAPASLSAPSSTPAPAPASLFAPSSNPALNPTPQTAISPSPSVSAPLLSPPAPPTAFPAEGPAVGGPTAGKSSASFAAPLNSNVGFVTLAFLARAYCALMFRL